MNDARPDRSPTPPGGLRWVSLVVGALTIAIAVWLPAVGDVPVVALAPATVVLVFVALAQWAGRRGQVGIGRVLDALAVLGFAIWVFIVLGISVSVVKQPVA